MYKKRNIFYQDSCNLLVVLSNMRLMINKEVKYSCNRNEDINRE
jgi:hypothetical protein|nr:MAG TPA: hypothetical protein [Bacteriophage sp.]DAJ60547.1 MAG TPA: hypothetical protein [Caudoviricetes sp.]DAO32108.1 MAG TPA: hypothetical protein [Caudoviricetes sp.]